MLIDELPFSTQACCPNPQRVERSLVLGPESMSMAAKLAQREVSIEAAAASAIFQLLHRYTGSGTHVFDVYDQKGKRTTVSSVVEEDTTVGEHVVDVHRQLLANAKDGSSAGQEPGTRAVTVRFCKSAAALGALSFGVGEAGMGLSFLEEEFAPTSCDRLLAHTLALLQGTDAHWKDRISELALVLPEERDNLLNEWHVRRRDFGAPRDFYEMFREQAQANPDRVVLYTVNGRFTYRELLSSVDHVAAALQQAGVGPQTLVGVSMKRSETLLIVLLAIIRVRAVYVPLDKTYPMEYLSLIAQQCTLRFVIVDARAGAGLTGPGRVELLFDELLSPHGTTSVREYHFDPDGPFTVLHTSGSTGIPKGVVHAQRSFWNRFSWMWSEYPYKPSDVLMQRTTLNFGPSIWEFLAGALKGIPTVVASDSEARDPKALTALIASHSVTRLGVVPTLLRMMLSESNEPSRSLRSLEKVSCAGEPLSREVYLEFTRTLPECHLYNDYGSTEINGIFFHDVSLPPAWLRNPPVGQAVANVPIYILDDVLKPVPPYVAGNLFVGGLTLFTEYQGGEKPFEPDPIQKTECRFFNTGDRAMFLYDGSLALLGRRDHQVKIRGMRVNTQQLESIMRSFAGVREVVVFAVPHPSGDSAIVATVESEHGSELPLRSQLKHTVPPQLIPQRIYFTNKLLRKPNGKLDRTAEQAAAAARFAAGFSDASPEQGAAGLVRSVLGIADDDDLELSFEEWGLNSVSAVELVGRLSALTGHEFQLSVVHDHDSPAKLIRHVENLRAGIAERPETAPDFGEILSGHFAALPPVTDRDRKVGARTSVFVTGATGFFGAFLVDELLRLETVQKVSVLVRGESIAQAREKFKLSMAKYGLAPRQLAKVEVIHGDVAKPGFGLPPDIYQSLSCEVGTIYHCAAEVNHFHRYRALERTNVVGTSNVIRFAADGHGKQIIFASTIAALMRKSHGQGTAAGAAEPTGDAIINGYGQSKWMAEQLLVEAARRGHAVSIVRFGELSGHSQTGVSRLDDVFHNCLKVFSEVPAVPAWKDGFVDVVPVDVAAQAAIEISRANAAGSREAFVCNLVSPNPLPVAALFEHLHPGLTANQDFAVWVARCSERISSHPQGFIRVFSVFFKPGSTLSFRDYFQRHTFETERARQVLSPALFERLTIDETVLDRYLSHGREVGFIAGERTTA